MTSQRPVKEAKEIINCTVEKGSQTWKIVQTGKRRIYRTANETEITSTTVSADCPQLPLPEILILDIYRQKRRLSLQIGTDKWFIK